MERSELVKKLEELYNSQDYEKIIQFNRDLDDFFDLRPSIVEEKIRSNKEEYYVGLETEALLTPYCDFYQILRELNEKKYSLLDLGAAHCRGSVLAEYLGFSNCKSIEIVRQRVECAKKSLKKISGNLNCVKLGSVEDCFEAANAYYLYFPKGNAFYSILNRITKLAKNQKQLLYICESHGDTIDLLMELSNFKKINEFPTSLPRHYPYIVKFEVSHVDHDFDINQNIWNWFLQNYRSNQYLQLNFLRLLDGKYYNWILPLKEIEPLRYQGKVCLNYISKNRIINLETEVESMAALSSSQIPVEALEALHSRTYKKIFIGEKTVAETKSGDLITL